MSTVTDLGTFGATLVGVKSPGNNSPTDFGSTNRGLPTSTNRRLTLNHDDPTAFVMTGFDTNTSSLLTWSSFADPTTIPPPTADPVINVSATKIR